ncbi:MAG TPA: adenylate kinase [Gemmataceae bacterium]|nr:adenylate kinase [Gemmataceae bacterium]
MRLILLGPPGSGKGTQAKRLSERLGLEHIGTGDILRDAISRGTPVGLKAHPYVRDGLLVPDDVVNEVVAERFRADRPERFVMDGYPRTLAQAVSFDQVLRQEFLDLSAVVLLLVDDEEIVRRVVNRWSCPKLGCKATYHTLEKPPKAAGVCDLCGTKLIQREDDKPETVRARLQVYHRNIVQLLPYYRARGLVREVCGEGDIETIYRKILQVLNVQEGPPC